MIRMNLPTCKSENDDGRSVLYVSFNATLFALVRTSLKIHCSGTLTVPIIVSMHDNELNVACMHACMSCCFFNYLWCVFTACHCMVTTTPDNGLVHNTRNIDAMLIQQ